VHGFAGNMLPLIHGWKWLTDDQRSVVADAVPRTLAAHASRSDLGAAWPAIVPSSSVTTLCQHCHGAPGMVTVFADAPFSTPDFEALLLGGGEETWNAGPLVNGPGMLGSRSICVIALQGMPGFRRSTYFEPRQSGRDVPVLSRLRAEKEEESEISTDTV
jgi:hypothetical protein